MFLVFLNLFDVINWMSIKTSCFLAWSTQTLCKIAFSSALLTCLVLTSTISSFSSSKFLYEKACVSKIVPRYLGSWANQKDQVVHPMISGRGSSYSAALGGQSPAGRKRHQVRYQGLVRVGWASSTDCQQTNGMGFFLFFFSPSGKYFNNIFVFFSTTFLLDLFSFSE